MDFILIFQAFNGFSGFHSIKKKGRNRGIVAHLNCAISAIESSFSKSGSPQFSG